MCTARVIALMVLGFSVTVRAQTATTAGAVSTPFPTTQSIAIDWAISGDSNGNGVVTVRYRPMGAGPWKVGAPLVRVPAGSNTTGSFGSGGSWANKHSGSLFDLTPGTTWEIELTLTDPDGGGQTKTVTVATRAVPQAAANARVKNVTPTNFTAMLDGAVPGDVLLLAAGNYPAFTMEKSGTPTAPIVIRGQSVDGVKIGGKATLADLHDVFLENLTVNGEVRMKGSSNMVVRGCHVYTPGEGISFQVSGTTVPRNNYIVDNDVVGAAKWVDDQLSVSGYNGGEGIEFTGSGHEVCFNHVRGFRDDISLMEYDEAFEQTSIDICNNDIEEATDDAIEADSAMGNVRVRHNQVKNCFDGLSSQPNLGGPTYFVGNTMFNVLYTPFKFHNGTVGDQVFHNTVVKCGDAYGCYAGATWSRAVFRNNLFLGGPGGTYGGYGNGSGRVFDLADADSSCSFDFDGLGSIGTGTFEGKLGSTKFTSLAALRSQTTEAHAVQVDMSVFASALTFPANGFPVKATADLRLAAGGAAVDVGVALPGINDGFAGAAPDLGAFELGAAVPVYGPRSATGGGATGGGGTGGGAAGGGTAGTGGGGMAATGGGSTGTGGGSGAATGGGTESGADAGAAVDAGAGGASATGSCGCSSASTGPWEVLLGLLVALGARKRSLCSSR